MYKDSELEQLLGQLKKIDQKPKMDKPAYTMDENDINLLYSSAKKKALLPTSNQNKEKNSSIDKNFVLSLGQKRYSASDKELTLGEYLQKYSQIENVIEKERKNRMKYQNPNLEKLINVIEGNERKPLNNSAAQNKNNNLFLSRKVDERIDYEQERREQKTTASKTLFASDKINRSDVFTNNSKEERKPVFNRIENFSNAKASMTQERFMSPLSLEKFSTKNR